MNHVPLQDNEHSADFIFQFRWGNTAFPSVKRLSLAASLMAFMILLSLPSFSQKHHKEGDKNFDEFQYYDAMLHYKEALKEPITPKKKGDIVFRIAECYRLMDDMVQAQLWYAKAVSIGYSDPKAKLYLADACKFNQKFDEAIEWYKKYNEAVPANTLGAKGIESCEAAKKWMAEPTRYLVANVSQINSRQRDFGPAFQDKKYSTIVFTSDRDGSVGGTLSKTGRIANDVYVSTLANDGKWSSPAGYGKTINTDEIDGPAYISRSGDMMLLTRCPIEKKKTVNCKLFVCLKNGNDWGQPSLLPFNIDSFAFGHAALSDDGNVMVFSSNMRGTYGGTDLWLTSFNKGTNEWSKPVNLGPGINTEGDESFPFIHADKTLYFASNGHIGLGGMDNYKAEFSGDWAKKDYKWQNVNNLMYPLNSSNDDFGIIFEGKKEKGYFSSNRPGGKGLDDIWSFIIPECRYFVRGKLKVSEKDSAIVGLPIQLTKYTMKDNVLDSVTSETKSDTAGNFIFKLGPNTDYILEFITGEDYLNKKPIEGSTKKFKCDTSFYSAIDIQPVKVETIRLPKIEYEYAKWALLAKSKDSLNYLYNILIDNPGLIIELSAHTDSRGNNDYNRRLSQKRAQSCYDYLVKEKKINPQRIVPVGYGEDKLLFSDAVINALPTKEQQEALHAQNRRTVFRVLKTNFVDPNLPKAGRPKRKVVFEEKKDVEYENEVAPQTPVTPPTTPKQ